MKVTTLEYSGARQSNAQDKVLEGYVKRFRLRRQQKQHLHMFFSPNRVPKELTKDEVRLVIQLYPLLSSYWRSALGAAERFLKIHPGPFSASVFEITLPDELASGGRMTRARFREGIRKLLPIIG